MSSENHIASEDLCENCRRIGWQFTEEPDEDFQLGWILPRELAHIKASTSCKFCQLTLAILGLDEPDHVTKFESRYQMVFCDDMRYSGRVVRPKGQLDNELYAGSLRSMRFLAKARFYLTIKDGDWFKPQENPGYELGHKAHNIQLSVPVTDTDLVGRKGFKYNGLRSLSGRMMEDTVNIGLLKEWLRLSEIVPIQLKDIFRSPARSQSVQKIRTRLVDVLNGNLVSSANVTDYVALSYVWGGANNIVLTTSSEPDLSRPGGITRFHSSLPLTIRDTMELCRRLGYQYLWVDALCIRQDDDEDKAEQIRYMGQIYSAASFTIVQGSRAKSTNANTPLPGLRPGTRQFRQFQAQIRNHCFIATRRPQFSEAMEDSKWYSRGWTLQEAYLSRRLLFFTDYQVFLTSDSGHFFCEDTVFEHERDDVTLKSTAALHQQLIDWDYNPLAHDYFPSEGERILYLLHHYSKRNLSDEADVVAAVSGILQRYTEELGQPLFGIPEKMFDYTLCWSPAEDVIERRLMYPSWSWAGWKGVIRFEDNLDPLHSRAGITHLGPLDVYNYFGSTVIDPEETISQEARQQDPQMAEAIVRALTLEEVERYYQRLLGHDRIISHPSRGRFLHFMTSSCKIKIGSAERNPPMSASLDQRQKAYYDLEIPNGRTIVSVNRDWRRQQPDDLIVEFIAVMAGRQNISRSGSRGKSSRRAMGEDLNLIPIAWETVSACDHCRVTHPVAVRIGQISIVNKYTRKDSEPWLAMAREEKMIIFG